MVDVIDALVVDVLGHTSIYDLQRNLRQSEAHIKPMYLAFQSFQLAFTVTPKIITQPFDITQKTLQRGGLHTAVASSARCTPGRPAVRQTVDTRDARISLFNIRILSVSV